MDSWATKLFENFKPSIMETLSLTSGLDFTSARINSASYHYNRYGTTAILDIQLLDKNDIEEEAQLSIAAIYKQLHEGIDKTIIERNNAELIQLLESRQNSWPSQKRKLQESYPVQDNPEIPDLIFAPEIIKLEENYVSYSTLNRFVRRDKSGIPPLSRYKIMGYALGRFHGTEFSSIDTNLYSSYFEFLKTQNIAAPILDKWIEVLNSSNGGTKKYIFGDCSIENIQYNAITKGNGSLDSLCMLDPVLIQGGDRTEDLASVLTTLAKGKLIKQLQKNSEGSLRETLTQTLRYIVTQAGKELVNMYIRLVPDHLEQYETYLLDFFLGSMLLIQASYLKSNSSSDTALRDLLTVLGEQFLSNQPFADVYQIA